MSETSIHREISRLAEIHRADLERLNLRFLPDQVREVHGAWSVPMGLGSGPVEADDVSDLLRIIRRELEGKTQDAVTVFVDPDVITSAA